jgi:ABC-type branched-subunit amino acid transport system substrate-binding protein
MSKTSKIIGSIVAIVIIVLVIISVASTKAPVQPVAKETIKIGFVLPLSGGASYLGKV